MKKTYSVESTYNDMRIDRWVRNNIGNIPQGFIEKNLRNGKIKVNKKKNKSSYKLQKNDQIFISDFKFVQHTNKSKKNNYKPTKKEISFSSSIFIENNENFG